MDAQRRGVCKRSRHPRQFTSSSSFSTSSFSFPACTRGEVESSHARANCHVPFVYILLFPPSSQPNCPAVSIYLSISGTNTTFVSNLVRARERGSLEKLAPEEASLSFHVRRAFELTRERELHIDTFTHKSSLFFSPAFSLSLSRSLTQSLERSEPPT